MEDIFLKVGEKLKSARESLGLSQEKVASILDINRSMISYYENGIRKIDMPTLFKFADLYGIDVKYLLSEEGSPTAEISVLFRSNDMEDINEGDMKILGWSKRFLNNLCELKGILSEGR